jgi:polyphosphate kinase
MLRAVLVLPFLLLPPAARAHPHVFVDASAGFLAGADGRLDALRIVWLYDAFTTLVLYDQLGLDPDGDGQLDAADLAAVAAGETDWPPEYAGDTYLWRGGAAVALGRPAEAVARMVGDRLEVAFDLPLAEPLQLARGVFSLKLYDPGYYYAYGMQIAAVPALPGGCRAELIPFRADAATAELQAALSALSAEEVPDDPEIGARFADEIRLTCE